MEPHRRQITDGAVLNGRYKTLSPLNHGSFGMVSMAKDMVTGDNVAVKCFKKPSAGSDLEPNIKVDDRSEELEIHSHISSHPNIVNLLNSFESPTHTYLALEYCSMGDLYEAIRNGKGPKETEHVREFMLQLVDAVQTLHQQGVYHRDIKPENIFLADNGDAKLGDFGLATRDSWSYEVAVGSDRYMSPEQYDPAGNGLSPARADIWSIGICLLNILFSKNPFEIPAVSDPLFSDFLRDRQSLFDVFPSMSQDTFEVLRHCLAIDPAKRSLSLVREALERAISFTTDDVVLDEFCTENREVVTATANREPLRTPSFTSPNLEGDDTFPWTKALHLTPARTTRQLSVIHDNESVSEDLFPGSEISTHDWHSSKADTQSIDSIVDSGLGVSIGSGHTGFSESPVARSKPVPIAGSLPAFGKSGRGLSSFFGKKRPMESKSWSDMWDEEEEEIKEMENERTFGIRPPKLATLSQEDSEDDGRSTPRAGLAEIHNSALNTRRPSRESTKAKDDRISEHTGFVFEEHTPARHSPPRPAPTKRSLMDKWSALGERRRAVNNGTVTPKESSAVSSTQESDKSKANASNWRKNFGMGFNWQRPERQAQRKVDHNIWKQQEWNLSTDWRRSDQHLPRTSPMKPHASQIDGSSDSEFEDNDFDWVGGLPDLHL